MWRILQNVQRGFRQVHHSQPLRTTNVSQQSKKREDEAGEVISSRQPESKHTQVHIARFHSRVHSESSGHKHGGDNEREDWRSFKQHFNWSSCDQKTRICEAMGWGTAIVVGLQLCRQLGRINWWSDDDEKQRFQRAVYRFAYAMPKYVGGRPTTRASILAEGKNQQDTGKTKTPGEILDEASTHFEYLANESTGSVLNIVGLSQVQDGSLVKAAEQFRLASDLGYTKSLYNLGLCYEQGIGVTKSLQKAAEYYKLAAEKGHPMALYNLAVFYLLGLGGLPKDTHKAVELMEEAAEKGLQQAQVYMGIYYTEEPHQDMDRAVTFFEEGCKEEDAESQYYLGICYEQGWGVVTNEAKAADLYSKSAKQGHSAAQYNLAIFHELGMGGLPENREYARELYKEASQAGLEAATQSLERMEDEDRQRLKHDSVKLSQRETVTLPDTKSTSQSKMTEKQRSLHVSMSSPSLSSMVQQNDDDHHREQYNKPEWLNTGSISVLDLFIPRIFKGLPTPLKKNSESLNEINSNFDRGEWLKEYGVYDTGSFQMEKQPLKGSFSVAVI
ncbi:uncharacterized protein LOC144438593 [Glandiceps talaboti]